MARLWSPHLCLLPSRTSDTHPSPDHRLAPASDLSCRSAEPPSPSLPRHVRRQELHQILPVLRRVDDHPIHCGVQPGPYDLHQTPGRCGHFPLGIALGFDVVQLDEAVDEVVCLLVAHPSPLTGLDALFTTLLVLYRLVPLLHAVEQDEVLLRLVCLPHQLLVLSIHWTVADLWVLLQSAEVGQAKHLVHLICPVPDDGACVWLLNLGVVVGDK